MSEQKTIQEKFYKTNLIGEGKSGKIFEVLVLKDISYANKGEKLAVKEYKAWVLEEPFQTIRIAREGTTGSKIISNHLVKTYEIIEEQGNTYLVMELLDGISLSKYLENNPTLSFQELTDICLGILEGLYELHEKNLIHRDIKPANIMITSRGPVITDFGVIKDLNESITITGDQFLGTIIYAAPELLFGKSNDDKSIDIFSFGMILYELIFKKPYFDKSIYWSEIILLKKNPITFPLFLNSEIWQRFGFRESIFLSSILQGILSKPDLRLTSKQLYSAFSNNIWSYQFLHYVNSDVISIWPDIPEILKTKLHTLLIKLEKETPSEIEEIIKNLYYSGAAMTEDYGYYKEFGVDDIGGWQYRLSELGLISEIKSCGMEYIDESVGFMTNLGWQFLLKYSQDVEKLIQKVRINSRIK